MLSARRHAAAALVFAALAIVWTFPLAWHLRTHLPGPGPGDNIQFLWDFWWMRTALASGLDFFYSAHLFAPGGVDLTLHTHLALPGFLGATVLAALPVTAALNLTILTSLFLNGFCSYLLAWRVTRNRGAAIVGGLVFGGSPYLAAHLTGHFNLTTAWTIPLVAMAAFEAARGSARWAVLGGFLLAVTAYIDYYYVVFGFALTLVVMALTDCDWKIAFGRPGTRSRRLAALVAVLMVADVAALAAIAITGGFDLQIGSMRTSWRGYFNPLQAFWILLGLLGWLRFQPRLHVDRSGGETWGGRARAALITTGVFAAGAAPILWHAIALVARGDYVTQKYYWRSAPRGIDAGTLFLGNPFHGLWGGVVSDLYRSLDIHVIESGGWLGVVPVALAVWAVRGRPGQSPASGSGMRLVARHWCVIGLLFFIWALGPHLMVFGVNTGMILPQAVLHYVPLLNNARIPGRAIVIVYLAMGVLAAIAVAEWRATSRARLVLAIVAALAIVMDYVPAPFPVTALDRPALYETLRDRPEQGVVCELPLGVRDGFGGRGPIDDRVFFYQTIHQRPLTGGYVSRLPKAVLAAYENDPLMAALLSLSERGTGTDGMRMLPDAALAGDRLRSHNIAFVMLNRRTASPELVAYVQTVLPLTLIGDEGDRSLYVVNSRQPGK